MKFNSFLIAAIVLLSGFQVSAQSPDNPANPRDEAGDIHNNILRTFSSMTLSPGMSNEQIAEIVVQIASSQSGALEELGIRYDDIDPDLLTEMYEDYGNNYSNLIQATSLSNESKAMAQRVVDATFDPSTTYASFVGLVKSQENELINGFGRSLSTSELNVMLDAMSVARHSAYLWIVEQKLGGGKSGENVGGGEAFVKPGRGWIIAGADLGGALLGGLAGAYYGSAGAYYITEGFE